MLPHLLSEGKTTIADDAEQGHDVPLSVHPSRQVSWAPDVGSQQGQGALNWGDGSVVTHLLELGL